MSKEEWDRLKSERKRLRQSIKEAQQRARSLREKIRKAEDDEMRQREELAAVEDEAEVAIAIEEANIAALEGQQLPSAPVPRSELGLSPFTWSLCDGLTDDFWSEDPCIPSVLIEDLPVVSSGS